ncbi:MAG: class I SAM-dependent methyltransferase, partial [Bdellovibrionales bacterium]|nr:class I SAM-dependent methyltransferase [Bdellovibrionales bacterium]
MSSLISIAEKGYIPDVLVRLGIRSLLWQRLREIGETADEQSFLESMQSEPIAVEQDAANSQHYELPAEFFDIVLGPNRKYSGCLWEDDVSDLRQAERKSLEQVVERAELKDGMNILELGCGWGSLTLWMAKAFPAASVTAVSNSAPQRLFIENECKAQGLKNVKIITADVAKLELVDSFDRVVS